MPPHLHGVSVYLVISWAFCQAVKVEEIVIFLKKLTVLIDVSEICDRKILYIDFCFRSVHELL